MLTQEQITRRLDAADRWLDGGIEAEIATLERRAADSEAWASRSPPKGGKRKVGAQAEAALLSAEATQLRDAP